MEMLDSKKIIEAPAYNFLRDEPDLHNTLYLTLSGSRAYGTNKADSDVDIRGVMLEPNRAIYGLGTFEQFEDRTTDTVIYGLKKFVSLCVNANPNALELLGTREECIVLMTPFGRLLRENAGLFLSRKVIQSFGSYASAQLRRLSNALCHDSYTPAEQEAHLESVLQGQIEHFNRTYTPQGDSMRIHLSEGDMPALLLDVTLADYPLRDFAGIYGEMLNVLKTYGKLNHRNRKKDDAHLYKHAMHLIRLLITGMDILKEKGICTFRGQEHDLLVDIRNGEFSFDEIMEMAKAYQLRFAEAAKRTSLPDQPDVKKIEALMMEIYAFAK